MTKPALYLALSLCIGVGTIIGILGGGALHAQSGGYTVGAVVGTCGTLAVPYVANTFQPITINTAGSLCNNL